MNKNILFTQLTLSLLFASPSPTALAGKEGGGGGNALEVFRQVGNEVLAFLRAVPAGYEFMRAHKVDIGCLARANSDRNIDLEFIKAPSVNGRTREAVVQSPAPNADPADPLPIILYVQAGVQPNYSFDFVAKELLRSCRRNDLVEADRHFELSTLMHKEKYMAEKGRANQGSVQNVGFQRVVDQYFRVGNVNKQEIPAYGHIEQSILEFFTLEYHKDKADIPLQLKSVEANEKTELIEFWLQLVENAQHYSLSIEPDSGLSKFKSDPMSLDQVRISVYLFYPLNADENVAAADPAYKVNFVLKRDSLSQRDLSLISALLAAQRRFKGDVGIFNDVRRLGASAVDAVRGERPLRQQALFYPDTLPIEPTEYSKRLGFKKDRTNKDNIKSLLTSLVELAAAQKESVMFSAVGCSPAGISSYRNRLLLFFSSNERVVSLGEVFGSIYDKLSLQIEFYLIRYLEQLQKVRAAQLEGQVDYRARSIAEELKNNRKTIMPSLGNEALDYLSLYVFMNDMLAHKPFITSDIELPEEIAESPLWLVFKSNVLGADNIFQRSQNAKQGKDYDYK